MQTATLAVLLGTVLSVEAHISGGHRHHHRGQPHHRRPHKPDFDNSAFAQDFGCVFACAKALGEGQVECMKCIDKYAGEIVQVPVSYAKDMLAFKLNPSQDYTQGWCGKKALHPEEGVDVSVYPSGWMPVVDAAGNVTSYTGCETTTDFPGIDTISHQSHAFVKEALKDIPRKQNDGEVWRGNELGFIVSSGIFWDKVSPRALLLGSNVNQHKVVRPILDEVFGTCDAACEAAMSASAAEFLSGRELLDVQTDIKRWVFEELFKLAYPGEVNPIPSADFVALQSGFLGLQPFVQLVPPFVGELMAEEVLEKLSAVHDLLRMYTEKHYGARVADGDCSPTEGGCLEQLTAAFLDTFISAGGLSVPSGISTALWVMYGDVASHGDMFPTNYTIDNNDVLPLYYESMRFFAPVVGFPWWDPAPERATDDFGSQFDGGHRTVLNLAFANRDPNVWGGDAHKFRVRPAAEYYEHFIGFAETAVDETVANGTMNRACPGKTTAIALGQAFLQNFNQSEWANTGNSSSEFTLVVPFIDNFILAKGDAGANLTDAPAGPLDNLPSLSDLPFGFGDYFQELIAGLGDPNFPQNIVDEFRFDLYTRGLVKQSSDGMVGAPVLSAQHVIPPSHHGEVPSTTVGVATHVIVPKEDESWPQTSEEAAQQAKVYAAVLPFPYHADMCGVWNEGEDPETIIKEMMIDTLNPDRVLVPWGEERHTDAGFASLVFEGVGQGRVERVKQDDLLAKGAKYAVYLNFAADLEVKPGFAKYGADAYFNKDKQVTHIVRAGRVYYPSEPGWASFTSANMSRYECRELHGRNRCWVDPRTEERTCICDVPARIGFKSAKMAFLGTLSAVLSVVDHLFELHLTVANSIVTANVEELPVDHAMRRLMQPFGFRTGQINWAAAFSLVNEFGLLHRSTALSKDGLRELLLLAQSTKRGETFKPTPQRFAAQNIDPEDATLPLHEDGGDFYSVIKTYIHSYMSAHWDYASNACNADVHMKNWVARINLVSVGHNLPLVFEDLTCEFVEELLTTVVYGVTAGHTHVGALGAEFEDPCHMPWAWREGETCGTPRTGYTQMLVLASTSYNQPKLVDDYTHIYPDEADKQLWRDFQTNLEAFGARVDARNALRTRQFKSFDIKNIEISVGI